MQHFFADRSWVQGDKIRLEGSDVNHMKNVLRMKEGEEVQVSDGTGNAYLCQIEGYEGDQAVLKIREKTEKDTELPSKIWLFQGLPKGDKMELDFDKMNGLVPAIIQDNETRKVLMLGFMNKEAYDKTVETGKVTFFSRTKNRLWTKGEESGNFLHVVSIKADCDNDTLLIQVNPVGPVCHTGTDTCWGEKNEEPVMFLKALQDFIDKRHEEMPEGSYTTSLFESGINKIAQKVGEEAVETVIEATNGTNERLIYEGADLIYHMIVLLTSKGYRIEDLARELQERHSSTWKKH